MKLVLPAAATVLFAAAMVWQAQTPDPVFTDVPAFAFADVPGLVGSPVDTAKSEAERTVLPEDTEIRRRTYGIVPERPGFRVTAVIGGRRKSSIHRPELCLPTQGFLMRDPHALAADGRTWRVIRLEHREASPTLLAYTFANQAGYRTSSHMARIFRDVWDRSVLNRIDRWVMVSVQSATDDEAVLARFLGDIGKELP